MLLLAVACGLVVIFGIFSSSRNTPAPSQNVEAKEGGSQGADGFNPITTSSARRTGKRTAAEIVAHRLKLYSKKQRALVNRLAEHYKLEVPAEMKQFFDALDKGDFDEAQRIFRSLRYEKDNSSPSDDSMRKFWRPIVEAYGAAEQANMWLAPGMV
jgi:hypothetical protein